MPDKDIYGTGRTRRWRAACNLLSTDGTGSETLQATRVALAAELRAADLDLGWDAGSFRTQTLRILERKLLGPARYEWLERVGIDEVRSREAALRAHIQPDIDRMYEQKARGKQPRAASRRKLTAEASAALSFGTLRR